MGNLKVVMVLSALFAVEMTRADCEVQTEIRNVFPSYEQAKETLRVGVDSHIDDLRLQGVSARFVKADGKEDVFPFDIPLWMGEQRGQPFQFSSNIQIVELEARYVDACKEIVVRQQFQDKLVSLGLNRLTAIWHGEKVVQLHDCCAAHKDNTIFIE